MRIHPLIIGAALLLQTLSLTAQESAPLAKIMAVEPAGGDETRKFFGRVVAKETVELAFQVGGQIVEFPAIEGEQIAKGGLVAQLDLEPFQLALDQAKAQQDQADRTLARLEQLEGNTVSQVSVDDAKTQADLAAIAVRNAERSLEQATLHAPFDALVAARNIANFSTLSAGAPVVRLHDMSEVRIEIDVPEIMFQKAGEDPDVELWAKFPASTEQFALEPREFNAETSQVGQTFQLTLGMSPQEHLVVLPGSSVEVTAILKGVSDSPEIPLSAVSTANDGTAQVMVFEPAGAAEGTVRLVPIEIEPSPSGTMRVLSGIEAGQEIIASGTSLLADGMTVRRFTGFAN